MICLPLACAAEPVSSFLPKDNEDISALCLVIGRELYCFSQHDLIAFLCSNHPFHIPSHVPECLTQCDTARGGLVWLVIAVTLKGQEILQSVGQTVLPLLIGCRTPGEQQVPPGSAPAVKVSQKLFQILQPIPQLLRL